MTFTTFNVGGKLPPTSHKDAIAGGCGNIECEICYTSEGFLRDPGGRIQTNNVDDASAEKKLLGLPSEERAGSSIFTAEFLDLDDSNPKEEDKPMARRKILEEDAPNSYRAAKQNIDEFVVYIDHKTAWNDVVGNEDAKLAIRDAIESKIKFAELYEKYEMKPTSGVLLWGPPGNGKTMLGKAAAAAIAKFHGIDKPMMLLINGAQIESPLMGMAARKVKALFQFAREYKKYFGSPLLVFFDEADSAFRPRTTNPMSAELVGSMLAEMDGINESSAFVVMTSNRPEYIDPALLRPGRCDRKIKVCRPTPEQVVALASRHMTKKSWIDPKIDPKIFEKIFDPDLLVKKITNPETGADHHFLFGNMVSNALVVNLIEQAKKLAFERDKKAGKFHGVHASDIEESIVKSYNESKDLVSIDDLRDFIQEVALPAEEARKYGVY